MIKTNIKILLLISMLCLINTFANAKRIFVKKDSLSIKQYFELGKNNETISKDTALYFYSKVIDIASDSIKKSTKKIYKQYLSIALQNSAYILFDKQQYKKTISLFKESIKLDSLIENKKNMGLCYKNIGLAYKMIGEYKNSKQNYIKALNIRQEIGDTLGSALLFYNIANLHYTLKEYDKALKYFSQSLEIYKKHNNVTQLSNCINNIGNIYTSLNEYDKALVYYNKVLNNYISLDFQEGIASVYNNIGVVYKSMNQYDKAISYFTKTLDIYIKQKKQKSISKAYNNIGNTYISLGDYKQAYEVYNKALKINLKNNYTSQLVEVYNNLGIISKNIGENNKAIDFFKKSISISQKFNYVETLYNLYQNIGNIYIEQGNDTKALINYNISLQYIDKNNKLKLTDCYNNIGNIYQMRNNFEEAKKYYQKSLIISENINNKYGISNYYNNIGIIHENQHNFNKAIQLYKKSLDIKKELGDKKGESLLLGNISSALLLTTKKIKDTTELAIIYNKVVDYSKNGLTISKEINFKLGEKTCCNNLATAYIGLNNYDIAEKYLLRKNRINNEDILINFSFLSENEQEIFLNTIKEDYNNFYAYALKRKKQKPEITNYVYNNIIKNKELLLKSSIAMKNAIFNSNNPKLISEYKQWIKYKKELFKLSKSTNNNNQLKNKTEEIEKSLISQSQIFNKFKTIQSLNWLDIKSKLKHDEIAIEFINFKSKDSLLVDNNVYCALTISNTDTNPVMLYLFDEKKLESIIGVNNNNGNEYINQLYGTNREPNFKLYNLIWKPLESLCRDKKTIYISASGLLHKVSFAALSKQKNKYLCDDFNIQNLSSTIKISLPDTININAQMTASIYGGIDYNTSNNDIEIWKYLDGTKKESQEIYSILSSKFNNVKLFSEKEATESKFKDNASKNHIVHIATHGFFFANPSKTKDKTFTRFINLKFRGENVQGFGLKKFIENKNALMRSGLIFSGANNIANNKNSENDGILTALEVTNLNMQNTELVVLSACETGLGDIKGSEGVYGLQRAFKIAGANFIIISLWKVSDYETTEFMIEFYKELLLLNNIKDAFHITQRTMREKYNPYFWASFILIE